MQSPDSHGQGHADSDHASSFFRKLRLDWLLSHFPPRLVRSTYVFVNGFVTIALLALLAFFSRNPFVFPSLGPTAYLLFLPPRGTASCRSNVMTGHASGLLAGYGACV